MEKYNLKEHYSGRYHSMPNILLSFLPSDTYMVFAQIYVASHDVLTEKTITLSKNALVTITGFGRRKVTNCLLQLEQLNLITVSTARGQFTAYKINWSEVYVVDQFCIDLNRAGVFYLRDYCIEHACAFSTLPENLLNQMREQYKFNAQADMDGIFITDAKEGCANSDVQNVHSDVQNVHSDVQNVHSGGQNVHTSKDECAEMYIPHVQNVHSSLLGNTVKTLDAAQNMPRTMFHQDDFGYKIVVKITYMEALLVNSVGAENIRIEFVHDDIEGMKNEFSDKMYNSEHEIRNSEECPKCTYLMSKMYIPHVQNVHTSKDECAEMYIPKTENVQNVHSGGQNVHTSHENVQNVHSCGQNVHTSCPKCTYLPPKSGQNVHTYKIEDIKDKKRFYTSEASIYRGRIKNNSTKSENPQNGELLKNPSELTWLGESSVDDKNKFSDVMEKFSEYLEWLKEHEGRVQEENERDSTLYSLQSSRKKLEGNRNPEEAEDGNFSVIEKETSQKPKEESEEGEAEREIKKEAEKFPVNETRKEEGKLQDKQDKLSKTTNQTMSQSYELSSESLQASAEEVFLNCSKKTEKEATEEYIGKQEGSNLPVSFSEDDNSSHEEDNEKDDDGLLEDIDDDNDEEDDDAPEDWRKSLHKKRKTFEEKNAALIGIYQNRDLTYPIIPYPTIEEDLEEPNVHNISENDDDVMKVIKYVWPQLNFDKEGSPLQYISLYDFNNILYHSWMDLNEQFSDFQLSEEQIRNIFDFYMKEEEGIMQLMITPYKLRDVTRPFREGEEEEYYKAKRKPSQWQYNDASSKQAFVEAIIKFAEESDNNMNALTPPEYLFYVLEAECQKSLRDTGYHQKLTLAAEQMWKDNLSEHTGVSMEDLEYLIQEMPRQGEIGGYVLRPVKLIPDKVFILNEKIGKTSPFREYFEEYLENYLREMEEWEQEQERMEIARQEAIERGEISEGDFEEDDEDDFYENWKAEIEEGEEEIDDYPDDYPDNNDDDDDDDDS